MTPADQDSLAKTMKLLNNRYVWHFNKLHERTGGLWEGRYTAKHVATDRYLRICYQYIELNPVRAGFCRRARNYIWSSHRLIAVSDQRRGPGYWRNRIEEPVAIYEVPLAA